MTKADRLLEKTRPKEAIILLTDAFWTLGTAAAMAKACSHWADARLGKAQKNNGPQLAVWNGKRQQQFAWETRENSRKMRTRTDATDAKYEGFCLLLISRVKFATSNPGLLVLHKWRQLEENEQNLHRIYSTMLERSTVQL
ncbi:hypothetical protein T12_1467 [Trichinella patagoniensis]|nr:hypothetical protein T12_1467 [Trichinella patagoniensis]